MDGLEALQQFQGYVAAPVIFLTARRRELDQVLGLELGADDYVTKPFDLDVLLARMKVVLRRAQPATTAGAPAHPGPLQMGDLVIDAGTHSVLLKGAALDLSPREFALRHALALDGGQVLSVNDLLARVWGAEYNGESQVVYVHIRWLREKIEEDPQNPRRILTVRGVGYKLVPHPTP
jgi:DNA-binding response OmpR family regulator